MTDPRLLEERYGRSRGGRRVAPLAVALGVGALVVGVALLFWWARSTRPFVTWATLSYQVSSDTEVQVGFLVRKSGGDRAVCRVVAQDATGVVVGERDLEVPSGRSQTETRATVVTTARAILGRVDSCRVVR